MRTGRFDDAARAYANIARLKGETADTPRRSGGGPDGGRQRHRLARGQGAVRQGAGEGSERAQAPLLPRAGGRAGRRHRRGDPPAHDTRGRQPAERALARRGPADPGAPQGRAAAALGTPQAGAADSRGAAGRDPRHGRRARCPAQGRRRHPRRVAAARPLPRRAGRARSGGGRPGPRPRRPGERSTGSRPGGGGRAGPSASTPSGAAGPPADPARPDAAAQAETESAMAAVRAMPQAERDAAIRGMVEGLDRRLGRPGRHAGRMAAPRALLQRPGRPRSGGQGSRSRPDGARCQRRGGGAARRPRPGTRPARPSRLPDHPLHPKSEAAAIERAHTTIGPGRPPLTRGAPRSRHPARTRMRTVPGRCGSPRAGSAGWTHRDA